MCVTVCVFTDLCVLIHGVVTGLTVPSRYTVWICSPKCWRSHRSPVLSGGYWNMWRPWRLFAAPPQNTPRLCWMNVFVSCHGEGSDFKISFSWILIFCLCYIPGFLYTLEFLLFFKNTTNCVTQCLEFSSRLVLKYVKTLWLTCFVRRNICEIHT